MSDGRHEPPRVLGFARPGALRRGSAGAWWPATGPAGEEVPRVLGLPVTMFEGVDRAFFAALCHPRRAWRARRAQAR